MVSRPLVQGMAAICAIERREVRGQAGSLVARCAGCGLVWDSPPSVVEGCRGPGRRVVAGRARARRRETGAGVIRDISTKSGSALPVRCVATVAIDRRRIRSCVAEIAGHGGVRASQCKACCTVIECRAQPVGRRVAGIAGFWKSGRDVIRNRATKSLGAVPIGSVAAVTIGWQRAAVIAVHVAQGAGNGGVRAGQRKRGCAVIECGTGPIRRGMADRTVRWKRCCNVIRNCAA